MATFGFGLGFGIIKDILFTIITFLATQKVGCQISVGIIIHYCYVKRDMYMNRLSEGGISVRLNLNIRMHLHPHTNTRTHAHCARVSKRCLRVRLYVYLYCTSAYKD